MCVRWVCVLVCANTREHENCLLMMLAGRGRFSLRSSITSCCNLGDVKVVRQTCKVLVCFLQQQRPRSNERTTRQRNVRVMRAVSAMAWAVAPRFCHDMTAAPGPSVCL